jgi:hypothetical protein
MNVSRDSSVVIVTGYGLDIRDLIWVGATDFSLFHRFKIISGAQCVGYRGLFTRGVKLITHLNLVSRSEIMELYLYFPIHLHGAVLN